MNTQAQKALRVILNVSRHRETPAEERDRLVDENSRLTDALVVATNEAARLTAEATLANMRIQTLENAIARKNDFIELQGQFYNDWLNREVERARQQQQQQQRTIDTQNRKINAQFNKICILKAKLKTKKRESG